VSLSEQLILVDDGGPANVSVTRSKAEYIYISTSNILLRRLQSLKNLLLHRKTSALTAFNVIQFAIHFLQKLMSCVELARMNDILVSL
jgi:hypothetical protein